MYLGQCWGLSDENGGSFSIGAVGDSGSCEEGWYDASFVDLGCIHFAKEKLFYNQANIFCQNNWSHLIEIHTPGQMDFIRMELEILDEGLSAEQFWWTAGTDYGREGQWYWQHSLTKVEEFVWPEGFPRNYTDFNLLCFCNVYDYLAVDTSGFFDAKFICQK